MNGNQWTMQGDRDEAEGVRVQGVPAWSRLAACSNGFWSCMCLALCEDSLKYDTLGRPPDTGMQNV